MSASSRAHSSAEGTLAPLSARTSLPQTGRSAARHSESRCRCGRCSAHAGGCSSSPLGSSCKVCAGTGARRCSDAAARRSAAWVLSMRALRATCACCCCGAEQSTFRNYKYTTSLSSASTASGSPPSKTLVNWGQRWSLKGPYQAQDLCLPLTSHTWLVCVPCHSRLCAPQAGRPLHTLHGHVCVAARVALQPRQPPGRCRGPRPRGAGA